MNNFGIFSMESTHDNNSTNKIETHAPVSEGAVAFEGDGTQSIADPSISFGNPNDLKKPDNVLYLQRTLGNQATRALVGNHVQRKPETDSHPFSGLSITDNLSMMQRDHSGGDQIQRDANDNEAEHKEVSSLDNNGILDSSQHYTNMPDKGISTTQNIIDMPLSANANKSRLQRTPAQNITKAQPSTGQSKPIQRGAKLDMLGKGLLGFGKGLADATILGGAVSWYEFFKDIKNDKGMSYEDKILYGEGKTGIAWKILDKEADLIKAFTATFTSLGVIAAVLGLMGWAPAAALAGAFGLLAAIGHGIAMILKSIMFFRDNNRLAHAADKYGKKSKEYAMVRGKRWQDGASAVGSLLGLVSTGILGAIGGGNFFGSYDPAGAADTISKGVGSVAVSSSSAQGFGSGADVAGGVADGRNKTITSGNFDMDAPVAPILGDHADDTEDDTSSAPATSSAPDVGGEDPHAAEKEEVRKEIIEEALLAERIILEDSEQLDRLKAKMAEHKKALPEIGAKINALAGETGAVKEQQTAADDSLKALGSVTDSSNASDDESAAKKLEEFDPKMTEIEDNLDLPEGTDFTIVITDENGVDGPPDVGGGTIPGSSESMPPPSIVVTDEHGVDGPPDVGGGTIPGSSESMPSIEEPVALKRQPDATVQHVSGDKVLQRGIGAKIKKKFGSIKKWMMKKLANFKGRLVKIIAKIKARITSGVMKLLGVDKNIAALKPSVEENKVQVPQALEAGQQATDNVDSAKDAIDALKDATK
jgi:hypothetical protein